MAIENPSRAIYGFQFHPEVMHTESGMEMIKHFLTDIAKVPADWNMGQVLEEQLRKIADLVSGQRASERARACTHACMHACGAPLRVCMHAHAHACTYVGSAPHVCTVAACGTACTVMRGCRLACMDQHSAGSTSVNPCSCCHMLVCVPANLESTALVANHCARLGQARVRSAVRPLQCGCILCY